MEILEKIYIIDLNVLQIDIEPLSNRVADIPILIELFFKKKFQK